MNRTDSLALFVKAVDTGSLSGAARALRLSLPSVSRHITALEERIGTRLVIRTTRSLALTEAGRFITNMPSRSLPIWTRLKQTCSLTPLFRRGKSAYGDRRCSAAFF